MNTFQLPRRSPVQLWALLFLTLAVPACDHANAAKPNPSLPQAYVSHQIVQPQLQKVATEVQTWASRQTDAQKQKLYSRVEVLPPVPTVQPYGVGVFQQEERLPVICTTGPGWKSLKVAEKEEAAQLAFNSISKFLDSLKQDPALQPTLTIQTPEGMELAWINHLEPNGKYIHGEQ